MIPTINRIAPEAIILNLFLKKKKDDPIPSPNNPVVKGKTISSVGCKMNNNIMVRKYDFNPNRMENMVQNRIGAVAIGLIKNPIPGK